MSGEVPAAIDTPMEDFINGANIMAEDMASTSTAIQGAPTEDLTPPPKLVLVKKNT